MGNDRTSSKSKKSEKIQFMIKEEFNLDYNQLYEVWLLYCSYIAQGINSREAIKKIEKENFDYWNRALEFFTVYGLNNITFKIDKGIL